MHWSVVVHLFDVRQKDESPYANLQKVRRASRKMRTRRESGVALLAQVFQFEQSGRALRHVV